MRRNLIPVISVFVFVLVISSASAQNVSVGIRGGLTIPNLTGGGGTPLSEGYSTRSALGFGAFAEFKITKLFSIQPMLEYSQQGAKKNGLQVFPYDANDEAQTERGQQLNQLLAYFNNGKTPQYLYANFKSVAKINYLMLPVLAKFGWDLGHQSHWRIYADVGPYAGLLLNAHQIERGGAQVVYLDSKGTQTIPVSQEDPSQILAASFDTSVNIKSEIHKFNFGVEGNVGISYKFKRNSIFIEGGGNYGLLNIQKYASDGKNHSGAGTIMLGYALTL